MCPPQSGPLRTNPVVRGASYSPHTPVHRRQKQKTSRFEQSLSPFPGLTSAQVKKLNEHFEKTQTKVDLISEVYQELCGYAPKPDEVVRALVNSKSEPRTFASLGTRDYDILNPGEEGLIQINLSRLMELVPATNIPNEFWSCLTALRTVSARTMGMGVRQVIGHFLTFAIVIGRKLFERSVWFCTPNEMFQLRMSLVSEGCMVHLNFLLHVQLVN